MIDIWFIRSRSQGSQSCTVLNGCSEWKVDTRKSCSYHPSILYRELYWYPLCQQSLSVSVLTLVGAMQCLLQEMNSWICAAFMFTTFHSTIVCLLVISSMPGQSSTPIRPPGRLGVSSLDMTFRATILHLSPTGTPHS